MITFVRVDDRLLHGQIICAWVPHVKADSLIVASDEAAGDSLVAEIMGACSCDSLKVEVYRLDGLAGRTDHGRKVILIFGSLADAMRAYSGGVKFAALNIGNVHHEVNGRKVAPSVILNVEDDEIIEKFIALGVAIDIRDVPTGSAAKYTPRKRQSDG